MPLVESFVEVTLPSAENFLKVRETLTRIGVTSKTGNRLYQSCHILHKKGKYYIVHFKEMFALDGLAEEIPETDIARRNTVANLLSEWGLVVLVDPSRSSEPTVPVSSLKILPFGEKEKWELVPKYTIGRRKTDREG